MGAIDPCDPRRTEKDICIGCMCCVGRCPKHARDFDSGFMVSAEEYNRSVLTARDCLGDCVVADKEKEIFYLRYVYELLWRTFLKRITFLLLGQNNKYFFNCLFYLLQ